MAHHRKPQREQVIDVLGNRGMARMSELVQAGASATSIARLEREGVIVRLGRGLYQLPGAPLDIHHGFAEAAKLAPRGVVCLVSALAFHDLTDQIPAKVWIAIDRKHWKPRVGQPLIRFVSFAAKRLSDGVETHSIEGIPVRITDPVHTVVDMFRYRKNVGQHIAVEGLKAALRTRKATPGDVARLAAEARVWTTVRPYVEALTIDA